MFICGVLLGASGFLCRQCIDERGWERKKIQDGHDLKWIHVALGLISFDGMIIRSHEPMGFQSCGNSTVNLFRLLTDNKVKSKLHIIGALWGISVYVTKYHSMWSKYYKWDIMMLASLNNIISPSTMPVKHGKPIHHWNIPRKVIRYVLRGQPIDLRRSGPFYQHEWT